MKARRSRPRRGIAGLALAGAVLTLSALGPGASQAQAPVQSSPQTWAGQHSGVAAFAAAVVRDEGEWRALWSGLRSEAAPPMRAGQDLGVVVYLGLRNTGGFAVEIESVEREGTLTIVTVRTKEPARGSFVTQVLTTPYVLARIADDGAPVAFRRAAEDEAALIFPHTELQLLNAIFDELMRRSGADPD